jgi:hypothetical protein
MSIWFILSLWTVGALFTHMLSSVKATEAYVIAQTEYEIKVIRTVFFFLVFIFWIGILVYLIVDRFFLSKRINKLDEYPLEDQALDRALEQFIRNHPNPTDQDFALYLSGEEPYIDHKEEELFHMRAKSIERRMDPEKRWSVGPDGSLRKDR